MLLKFSFFLSFLLAFNLVKGQNSLDQWIGAYEGSLSISNKAYQGKNISMKLSIGPTVIDSIYDWHMTYTIDSTQDIRAYQLIAQDTIGYHYIIDEQNGIRIDAYLHNNKLISLFDVMDSRLLTTYTCFDTTILYETIVFSNDKYLSSGGQANDIPEVKSYPLRSNQSAILARKKN